MSYQIKLNVFEGPYDLLLFLIRKGELDVYDIPIAKITKEYLEYIEIMRFLDLEIAGEFIVMAATLMRIKARMLLPVYIEEDDGEPEDPREELVQSILEYQRIKDASERIEILEIEQREYFPRGMKEKDVSDEAPDEDFEMQMTIYELSLAYNSVIKQAGKETFIYVEPEPVTIEEKMDEIMDILNEKNRISFQKHLMQFRDKIIIVINFLAILELAKRKKIRISQSQTFNEIWINIVK